jgi:hypothetical protein
LHCVCVYQFLYQYRRQLIQFPATASEAI